MEKSLVLNYIKEVVKNSPDDWLKLTTHRLDIYDEELAKTKFVHQFEDLFKNNNASTIALSKLATAYDYIRLGHPLSCILEWGIAKLNGLQPKNVIAFQSVAMPVLAILRKNKLEQKKTQIFYTGELPKFFNTALLKSVYGFTFDLKKVENASAVLKFKGTTILISEHSDINTSILNKNIDFYCNIYPNCGSLLVVNGIANDDYISDIQHVRRREAIAMTPLNSMKMLKALSGIVEKNNAKKSNIEAVQDMLKHITGTVTKPVLGSSGLSVQYAIMMGLVHDAQEKYLGKRIKFIVPPNCYGGTNDQARRVAASIANVDVVDLPVDGDNDMVQSIDAVLAKIAIEDGVPYIIAEIPTNPRVEVPDLQQLKAVLSKKRETKMGDLAIAPVFILDQTFCPNVRFLGAGEVLSTVKTIAYVSGSKFPSGGLCTAGYCVANIEAESVLCKIEEHLILCDNVATKQQVEILEAQLPSMNKRILAAYKNTLEFVNFIKLSLPTAKINFVSLALARQGFTPSVFSLDLPTKGTSLKEKETLKRLLNHKLIQLMISKIPDEGKHCVSYGQLKGSYWTIPATSTQGTTKEGDKDYIVRVSLSPNMNLELHKKVFTEFVAGL